MAQEQFQPSKLSDLPEVMFIQIILCPSCGKETRVNVPAMPSDSSSSMDTKCNCGSNLRASRLRDGSYTINTAPCCFVVTATFGERSVELTHVQRRCYRVFQNNSLYRAPYKLYQTIGPGIAVWAQSSPIRNLVARHFLANPIRWAVSRKRLVSWPATSYLLILYVIATIFCHVTAARTHARKPS